MMIGAQTPSSRRRRQVSNPSMPGSITSSTTASNSVAPAIHSASSPRAGDVGDKALEAQPAADRRRHPGIVFHHENPHPINNGPQPERKLRCERYRSRICPGRDGARAGRHPRARAVAHADAGQRRGGRRPRRRRLVSRGAPDPRASTSSSRRCRSCPAARSAEWFAARPRAAGCPGRPRGRVLHARRVRRGRGGARRT